MHLCLRDRSFSTYWQGMCVGILNNQIYPYLQHKGKYFTTNPKRDSVAVCFEDSIAEKSKCVGKYKRNNESCPLCYLYIDDMFKIFAT